MVGFEPGMFCMSNCSSVLLLYSRFAFNGPSYIKVYVCFGRELTFHLSMDNQKSKVRNSTYSAAHKSIKLLLKTSQFLHLVTIKSMRLLVKESSNLITNTGKAGLL